MLVLAAIFALGSVALFRRTRAAYRWPAEPSEELLLKANSYAAAPLAGVMCVTFSALFVFFFFFDPSAGLTGWKRVVMAILGIVAMGSGLLSMLASSSRKPWWAVPRALRRRSDNGRRLWFERG